jgi:YHS domain-containing protein
MRQILLVTFAISLAACGRGVAPADPATTSDVRTMASVDPKPVVIDAPPMLQNDAPIPKASQTERNAGAAPVALTEQDEELRSKLPFAPAIAMDPVDGNKISILATTPTFEYKGKIYYFANPEHRATFVANPEDYTKGTLSRL